LTFYQTCFGGTLHFELFDQVVQKDGQTPVVSGSLVSDRLVIYGSDLVHDEGRRIGNYIAVFVSCNTLSDRKELLGRLMPDVGEKMDDVVGLIEIVDAFDVRWVLEVSS